MWSFVSLVVLALGKPISPFPNFRCFTDDELNTIWQETRPAPTRSGAPIVFDRSQWIARKLGPTAAMILLKEVMHYEVLVEDLTVDEEEEVFSRLASGLSDVNLEGWTTHGLVADNIYDRYVERDKTVVDLQGSGSIGRYGWFVPGYVTWENDPIDFWRLLTQRPVIELLGSGGKIGSDRYVSHPFIPPWCGASQEWCAELIVPSLLWDNGNGVDVINNLKLNLTLTFVGPNFTAIIAERIEQKIPVIFGFYTPSVFSLSDRVSKVLLPDHNVACNGSSKLTGSSCDYPPLPLRKLMRAAILPPSGSCLITGDGDGDEPVGNGDDYYSDLALFLSRYQFHNFDQESILTRIMSNTTRQLDPSEVHVNEAACTWLHSNRRWRRWIENPANDRIIYANQKSLTMMLFTSIGLAVLALLVQMCLCYHRGHRVIFSAAFPRGRYFEHAVLSGLLVLIAVVFVLTSEGQKVDCKLRFPIFSVGYGLVIGTLAAKSYRTYCIFSGSDWKTIPSDRLLATILLGFIGVELLFCLAWFAFDSPVPVLELTSTFTSAPEKSFHCRFSNNLAFALLYCLPKVLVLAAGCFFGYKSSQVNYNNNESRKIAVFFYLVVVELVVWLPLTYFNDWNPTSFFLSTSTMIDLGILSCLLVVYVPKLWLIYCGNPQGSISIDSSIEPGGTNIQNLNAGDLASRRTMDSLLEPLGSRRPTARDDLTRQDMSDFVS